MVWWTEPLKDGRKQTSLLKVKGDKTDVKFKKARAVGKRHEKCRRVDQKHERPPSMQGCGESCIEGSKG
jgi:hypothetical protein